MVKLGEFNTLTVVKAVDFGLYLDGGDEWDEILLPNEDVPKGVFPGDDVKVFIYFDSEDRIVATTRTPYTQVGKFAILNVVSTSGVGAFLDWGLRKDLLVPFARQRDKMVEGRSYLVYTYVDPKTKRIVATDKIAGYLDQIFPEYERGEKVEILIARKSNLGYNVIINDAHWGLVYNNEIFTDVKIGQRMTAYIKEVREDEKIDVSLSPIGYQGKVDSLMGAILDKIKDNGGTLDISDKSSPDEIKRVFGCSKKAYKMALGTLMRMGCIEIYLNEVKIIEAE